MACVPVVENRIFVNHVPQSAKREDLAAHFAQFGATLDVYMPGAYNAPGQHKGMCFVTYALAESVELAMKFPQHVIHGQQITVENCLAKKGEGKGMPGTTNSGERIFVTNIPPDVSQEEVQAYFAQWGSWTDLFMPRGSFPAGHKGICFISYRDPISVTQVLQHGSHLLRGQPIVVDVAVPRGDPKGGGKGSSLLMPPAVMPMTVMGQDFRAGHSQSMVHSLPMTLPAMGAGLSPMGAGLPPMGAGMPSIGAGMQSMGAGMPVMAGMPPMGVGMQAMGPGMPAMGAGMHTMGAGLPAIGGSILPGRIFVTKMAKDITREDLMCYFQQFGELNDVYIPPGGKLIAFVGFREAAAAMATLQMKTHEIKPGSTVDVDAAVERPPLGSKGLGKSRFQPY